MDLEHRVALAAYYRQRLGLANAEIASILRVDVSSVSRYLSQAERNHWLVPRLELRLPPHLKMIHEQIRDPALEHAVRRAFEHAVPHRSMGEVIVAESHEASVIDAIGVLAGELLVDVLSGKRTSKVLGIAWGRTTYAMTKTILEMSPIEVPSLKVIPMQGGLGFAPDQGVYFADTMAQKLAAFFQTESPPQRLHLPAYVDAATARDCTEDGLDAISSFIQGSPSYQDIRSLYEELDIAVVGIGGLEPDAWALRSGFLPDADAVRELQDAGVCGDIVCRFYRDVEEDAVEDPHLEQLDEADPSRRQLLQVNRRAIGISLRQLKERAWSGARVIGLAGGNDGAKARAILGAMINGYITDLVTDAITAKQLVQLFENYASRPRR